MTKSDAAKRLAAIYLFQEGDRVNNQDKLFEIKTTYNVPPEFNGDLRVEVLAATLDIVDKYLAGEITRLKVILEEA